MVETTEIDIAAKIPGRLGNVTVREGAHVSKGDTLAQLDSREIDAKVGQARAAVTMAQSKLTLAKNGLRPQEKDAAEKLFLQAKAQADLMKKTWNRIKRLAADSIISSQERDQVEAQYISAQEVMSATKAKLSMAREGARSEDLAAATALVDQAQQARAEVVAWQDEKVVKSPIDGEIARLVMHCGEIVGAGTPIMTVIDPQDTWVTLMVKETDLSRFRMGTVFTGRVPALGDTTVSFVVTFIAPAGDFATWRPTNQKNGFDIKTFEVHLRLQSPVEMLRAGMSVNVSLDN